MIDCEIPFPIEEYKKLEEIEIKEKALILRGASNNLLYHATNNLNTKKAFELLDRISTMSDERLKKYSEVFDGAVELYKAADIIPIKDIPFAAKAVADQIDFAEYGIPERVEAYYKEELAEEIGRRNHPP